MVAKTCRLSNCTLKLSQNVTCSPDWKRHWWIDIETDILTKISDRNAFLTHAQICNGWIDFHHILGGWGCEIWPLPLTLALATNTVYCATTHTHDEVVCVLTRSCHTQCSWFAHFVFFSKEGCTKKEHSVYTVLDHIIGIKILEIVLLL